MKSESYKTAECCGDDCYRLGWDENQPCWGEVIVVDEVYTNNDDWSWLHACKGHVTQYHDHEDYTGKYTEEIK